MCDWLHNIWLGMKHKVFVSGCYDMLHSGHIAFFKEASMYGDLYVGIGSDATVEALKGHKTVCSERERLYMVKAIRYVADARVNSGSGMMDFIDSVDVFRPDIFVVNEDGDTEEKRQFCKDRGLEYVVLRREPETGLQARSSTMFRTQTRSMLPYRLDLAGTWIDQPYISKIHPGWAITISIEPVEDFPVRCGMSTSTRNAMKRIWPYRLPDYDPEMTAKLAFCFENAPSDTRDYISGAQDAIGICMPGLTRHWYNGAFWPDRIESCHDERILSWLESHLCMKLMWPRPAGTNVVKDSVITEENVKALADAAQGCWDAVMRMDLNDFARYYRESFEAQVRMFPHMVNPEIEAFIAKYSDRALAWKMPGAGGGGFLVMVCEEPLEDCLKVRIRRKELEQ